MSEALIEPLAVESPRRLAAASDKPACFLL